VADRHISMVGAVPGFVMTGAGPPEADESVTRLT
jgi:hypothetical protein